MYETILFSTANKHKLAQHVKKKKRSLIHLEFIFNRHKDRDFNFIFHLSMQCSQCHLLKRLAFNQSVSSIFVKVRQLRCVGLHVHTPLNSMDLCILFLLHGSAVWLDDPSSPSFCYDGFGYWGIAGARGWIFCASTQFKICFLCKIRFALNP